MSKVQELELKYIIENIELEIDFQDLSDEEIREKTKNLNIAKNKLKQIQAHA